VSGLTLSSQAMAAFTAEEAAELTAEAITTLKKFKAETKGTDGVFANAKGILVCPKIRKIGLGVGAERGKCVLTMGAEGKLYYLTSALKAGAILGAASHAMILVMNTDETLAKFTSGEREWEFGIDASVAVANVGAGGDLDTTNLKKDIVSFIFGEKGLMGDLSWEGSRFKKLDVK
jgi:lipid-binding SYLF domain-containing protein